SRSQRVAPEMPDQHRPEHRRKNRASDAFAPHLSSERRERADPGLKSIGKLTQAGRWQRKDVSKSQSKRPTLWFQRRRRDYGQVTRPFHYCAPSLYQLSVLTNPESSAALQSPRGIGFLQQRQVSASIDSPGASRNH